MKFGLGLTPKFAVVCGMVTAPLLAGCASSSTSGGTGGGGGGTAQPPAVPAAPSGLVATGGTAQVSLTWTGSPGATSYNVKRGASNGGPYRQIGTPTATTYMDSELTNGTTYYYVVAAVNSTGSSANSAQASATPLAGQTAPDIPTGLTATPGNTQVSLSWSASTGAASYHVKRSTTNGGPYLQVAAATTTAFTDISLTNGTTYYYVLSAVNAAGESPNSAQASATPAAPVKPDVTITIDPTKTKAISPYIYGLNFYFGNTDPPALLTFDRSGGNRWTAYNWETNASNAGSDYLYENDNYLSSSTVAGEAVRSFIAQDQGSGLASLMTVQLQGLVAGDENGPVSTANPPDMPRFKTVVDKKSTESSAPFTTAPVTTDTYVYMERDVHDD